jgi:hypothetical protein
MRRSLVRSSGTAFFVGLVALTAAGGVIAEAAELEEVAAADSQTSPAGVPDSNAGKRNLNTVPEDGLDVGSAMGPNNGLVRKLMAARPNEDLIICVAGCFSGRDRVVYAQPTEKQIPKAAVANPNAPANMNGASDGTTGEDANAALLIRGSQ